MFTEELDAGLYKQHLPSLQHMLLLMFKHICYQ